MRAMAGELILIVEDNDKNLKLVRDILRFKGYRTLDFDEAIAGWRSPDGGVGVWLGHPTGWVDAPDSASAMVNPKPWLPSCCSWGEGAGCPSATGFPTLRRARTQ